MKTLIVKYGELALKKSNRGYFEGILIHNIRENLTMLDGIDIRKEHGRIFIEFQKYEFEEVIAKVKDIFGIVGFASSIKIENSIEEMNAAAEILVKKALDENKYKTFKVEVKRANKSFEFKSPEVAREVGGYIYNLFDELEVDVHNPDLIVKIEIRKESYIYTNEVKGWGGLPYGTGGKGMLLLSGGIDSPVAGWMMAKRGAVVEAVHFHAYPFTSKKATEKVLSLAQHLSNYTGSVTVHSINILEIYREIQSKCPEKHFTIIGRRFMTMIAEKVAKENSCISLITGENIAQVASQTMEGLSVTNGSVSLPIFRPLIAFDKQDIIEISKKIGTYETSILPFEDCCTVFLPNRVDVRPKLIDVENYENVLDRETLIDDAIKTLKTYIITPETEISY
jgi:thiamine biosynthesis protein ThiI